MNRRAWAIAIGLAVVVFAAWFVAAPLLAFQALGEAARAGDTGKLAGLVDFPAVRTSLKDQLGDRLKTELKRDRKFADGPFGALGALIGPSIIDQVVDAAISPAGVAAMVASGRAPLADITGRKTALPPPAETAPPEAPDGARPAKRKTHFAYAGVSTFKAWSASPDDAAPLTWVLERRGLGWKLTGVELPPR